VNLAQMGSRLALLAIAVGLGLSSVGCASPAIGAPCLPEQVPENGFDDREAYVESSSVQCETRVCVVFKLRGDPRKDCVPRQANQMTGDPGKMCVSGPDVEDRIYCTCRCRSPGGFEECECADGFTCVDLLEQGGPGVRGGYCIKNGTYTGGS
jgi:hypothetical protein